MRILCIDNILYIVNLWFTGKIIFSLVQVIILLFAETVINLACSIHMAIQYPSTLNIIATKNYHCEKASRIFVTYMHACL